LPAIDAFFSLGSKYMQSDDIAYVFERAIQREQQYEQNRMNTRCVSSSRFNDFVFFFFCLGCFLR